MVSQQVDVPESGDAPIEESQGVTDLTPEGQDIPDSGAVDATSVENAVGTETTEAQPVPPQTEQSVEGTGQPEQVEQKQPGEVDQQSFGELRDQVRAQQEQLQYYSQLEQRAQIQRQGDEYRDNLQRQGYLPEQAQQAADAHTAQLQQKAELDQQAEQYRQFREGQRNAAVHYAKLHNLTFDDLSSLEKLSTPQEMETEAKRLSSYREMETELAQLKQQQVPAQSFDNNQPAPSASGSENDLLDKYNAGDRSEAAVNAARRLLGI